MNFLAHLHLSDGTPASMLGGVVADFVKGSDAAALPADVQQGVRLHRLIDGFTDKLGDRTDLRSARRDFEPFSTALADLIRSQPADRRAGLHVFECPMAPVLGTGRWLGRTAEVKNPFFGSAMLNCGEELP